MPRDEIFITIKLWNTHKPNAKEGLPRSLDALGVDNLELYVGRSREIVCKADIDRFHQLIHWPVRLVPVSALLLIAQSPRS